MKVSLPIAFLLLIFTFSCKESSEDKLNKSQGDKASNFTFIGDFYDGEVIELSFNGSVIFSDVVKANKLKIVSKYFLLDLEPSFKAGLRTTYNGKIYLDTVFWVNKARADENYKLTVTHPHPFDWESYYKDGVLIKKWGYLPIDSSLRFIHLTNY